MLVATYLLTRQAYFCGDKRRFFAATSTTNMCLWRQTRVCGDKSMLVATKMIFVAASASDTPATKSGRSGLKALAVPNKPCGFC